MVTNIEPVRSTQAQYPNRGSVRTLVPSRSTRRTMTRLEERTVQRAAVAHHEAAVAQEKVVQVNRVAREAINGYAFLHSWADHLAQGDAFLRDELAFFTNVAKLASGEVIADLVDEYCREARFG